MVNHLQKRHEVWVKNSVNRLPKSWPQEREVISDLFCQLQHVLEMLSDSLYLLYFVNIHSNSYIIYLIPIF